MNENYRELIKYVFYLGSAKLFELMKDDDLKNYLNINTVDDLVDSNTLEPRKLPSYQLSLNTIDAMLGIAKNLAQSSSVINLVTTLQSIKIELLEAKLKKHKPVV
jgi:hypothetical protein